MSDSAMVHTYTRIVLPARDRWLTHAWLDEFLGIISPAQHLERVADYAAVDADYRSDHGGE